MLATPDGNALLFDIAVGALRVQGQRLVPASQAAFAVLRAAVQHQRQAVELATRAADGFDPLLAPPAGVDLEQALPRNDPRLVAWERALQEHLVASGVVEARARELVGAVLSAQPHP